MLDYLVMGHVTEDAVGGARHLGGTAAYAAVTARALGLRVAVVTSCADTTSLDALGGISIHRVASAHTTTFENRYEGSHRLQTLHALARPLTWTDVPEPWRRSPIVHLAPVAQEVDPSLVRAFPGAVVGLTPQGWMRTWEERGPASDLRAESVVRRCQWPNARDMVAASSAVVLSSDDVEGDFHLVESWIQPPTPLVVTRGEDGAVVFWRGEQRSFPAATVDVVDPTGAGDVFAACFFTRWWQSGDAWSAAAAAADLATRSVTMSGVRAVVMSIR